MQAKLILQKIFSRKKKKSIKLGIFGEVGAGKTTLANLLSKIAIGKEMGSVTGIPHETRKINMAENLLINADGYELNLTLLDTPGITTYVDFREFMKYGLNREESINRAKEAAKGVVEAIKALDKVDIALLVVDSTRMPFDQVNMMLVGNLELKNIPFIIVANKIDREDANPEMVKELFNGRPFVEISALKGINIDKLLEKVAEIA